MIIGSDFNNKCQLFLKATAKLSGYNTRAVVAVLDVNDSLSLERSEIKHIVEYLEDMGFLTLETIGGPLLYGHISITNQGLEKADSD